ncbi:hypothetical protein RHMOL_Rhmol03G0010800 [Rhododendron molle]|uniref:Uncharacterized protein n=2 Tax=Rhododendron molle TaxID=49168 RepID=A0ACC0P929_RHOML|nr:hypothetical protein RHMOL_Rhmol03G0010800 [Rhododendron molle]KAI8562131.1 hypothetical protein RHMOL_Rhmol03G0010800 [Rhododendron molle]
MAPNETVPTSIVISSSVYIYVFNWCFPFHLNGLLVTSMLMVVIFDMDLEDDITHYISSDNAEGLKSLLSHRDVRNGTYSYCRTTLLQSLCLFSALKCATALVDGKLGIRVDVNRDPAVASLCS